MTVPTIPPPTADDLSRDLAADYQVVACYATIFGRKHDCEAVLCAIRRALAAEARVAELEFDRDMSRDPFVIDEARWLEERNRGAEDLARILLADDGRGVMTPGPCADAQALLRGLRQRVAELEAGLAELDALATAGLKRLGKTAREATGGAT